MKKKNIIWSNILGYCFIGIILLVFAMLIICSIPKEKTPVYTDVCDSSVENYKIINEVYNQLDASSQRNTSKPCENTIIKEIIVTDKILSYPISENKMKDYLNEKIYEVEFEDINKASAGNLVVYVDMSSLKVIGIRGGRD